MLPFDQSMLIVTIVLGVMILTAAAIGITLMATESKITGNPSATELALLGTKHLNVQTAITVASAGQFPDRTNTTLLYTAEKRCAFVESILTTNTDTVNPTTTVHVGVYDPEHDQLIVLCRENGLAPDTTVLNVQTIHMNKGDQLLCWADPGVTIDLSIVEYSKGPMRRTHTGPSPFQHKTPKDKYFILPEPSQMFFMGPVVHAFVPHTETTGGHALTLKYNNREIGGGSTAAATSNSDPAIDAIMASCEILAPSSNLETGFPEELSQTYSAIHFPGFYVKKK